jgi:alkylhydroperoxidase family enzyme
MNPRIDTTRISPDAYKATRGLQSYVFPTSLEPSLRELVNIRASQINACTFCLESIRISHTFGDLSRDS